jgi:hypothetical protein
MTDGPPRGNLREDPVNPTKALLKSGDLDWGKLPELVAQFLPAEDPSPPPVRIWAEGVGGWSFDYWRGLDGPVRWCAAGCEPTERTGRTVLEQAESGRLFAPDGELKWRLIPEDSPDGEETAKRCRLVFLGTRDWFPSDERLAPRTELEQLSPSASSLDVILWGQQTEYTPDEWIELRIPHRFRYPVHTIQSDEAGAVGADEAGSRRSHSRSGVRVRTEIWHDRWGTPHFMRLCDLVVYPI